MKQEVSGRQKRSVLSQVDIWPAHMWSMRRGQSHEEIQEEKGDSDSRSPLLTNPEVGVVASSRFFSPQPVPRSGLGMVLDCTAGK